jgi:hypothetical protein
MGFGLSSSARFCIDFSKLEGGDLLCEIEHKVEKVMTEMYLYIIAPLGLFFFQNILN